MKRCISLFIQALLTFLNPVLLFGLLAASIPIIIHLLNLRKLKTIEFSTLKFLKELQRTKMRRVKIKQWLLLLLRTLMVIAIVMAFARPALRGSLSGIPLAGAGKSKSTLVLLLDDSPSMSVRNEKGQLFSQAKDAASLVLSVVHDGDEVFFLPLSTLISSGSHAPGHSAGEVQKAIQSSQLSNIRTGFREALGVAARILSDSKNYNQEIYLITDGQATQFTQSTGDSSDLFDDRVRFYLTDLGSERQSTVANSGLTSAEITSRIITPNRSVALRTTVYNAGPVAVKNSLASLYLEGTRLAQQSLDIAGRGSVSPTFQFAPRKRGIQSGYIQIEDDPLEADNKRYFVLNVPSSVPVLAIGSTTNDTHFPSLALGLERDSVAGALFAVTRAVEDQFSSFDLNKFELVLLAGVKDFSASEADRLAQYVKAGGGIMLFPSSESKMDNYNNTLLGKLGIPPASPPISFGSASTNTFVSFSKIDIDHPIFDGLFEQTGATRRRPQIESPKVLTAIQPRMNARSRSLITLSEGTNFLTEYNVGLGKVLVFAVEAGLTWSDFPLKGIFVPLLFRGAMYTASAATSELQHQFATGDPIKFSVRLRERADKDLFVLSSPSGISERIAPQFSSNIGIATFSTPNSTEPGVYELRRMRTMKDGDVLGAVAVNVAKEETDLRHVTDDEFATFASSLGFKPEQVRRLQSSSPIDQAIMESRFGVELWKYFLGLAIVLGLLEMIVGREPKNEPQRV